MIQSPPLARSALHEKYLHLGAHVAVQDGWEVPLHFGDAVGEWTAATKTLGLGELPAAGVVELVGRNLDDLAASLGVKEVRPGTAAPIKLATAGDARWCRLSRHHARILLPVGQGPAAISDLGAATACAHATNISSGLTTLALLGPCATDLLARLVRVDTDPRIFADRSLMMTGAAGIPLQILRWDRGGQAVYELTVGRDLAEYFWDELAHAGSDLELRFLGVSWLARLEAVS